MLFRSLRERLKQDQSELKLLVQDILSQLIAHADEHTVDEIYRAIEDSVGRDYPWSGNVRELYQCIRQIFVNGAYTGDPLVISESRTAISKKVDTDEEIITANELLSDYCKRVYQKIGNYEKVGRAIGLDARTVRKYVTDQK